MKKVPYSDWPLELKDGLKNLGYPKKDFTPKGGLLPSVLPHSHPELEAPKFCPHCGKAIK